MTVVYLDSVFLFNALLDYLLFLSTARLAGIPLRRRRYLLCGVLGGLYAAAVFLPGGGFLTETLVKAGVGLLLALIAFGRETHFLRPSPSPAPWRGRFWPSDCWRGSTFPTPGEFSIRMSTGKPCCFLRQGSTCC